MKIKTAIKGAIRQLFTRNVICRDVLDNAVHATVRGVRGGKQYTCNKCKKTFSQKDVQVDHISPVVPLNKTLNDMDYNEIVSAIFCDISNLQVLCKPCHKMKTKKENNMRRCL